MLQNFTLSTFSYVRLLICEHSIFPTSEMMCVFFLIFEGDLQLVISNQGLQFFIFTWERVFANRRFCVLSSIFVEP